MIIYRKYFCAHIEAVLTIHSIPAAPAAATGLQYTDTSTMFLSARQACWNLSLMQHRKCPPPSQPRSSDRSLYRLPGQSYTVPPQPHTDWYGRVPHIQPQYTDEG